MPGGSRTVTLNVIGNVSGATKALDEVAGKSESTAKRASAAFGGVLSTLNSTGVLGPFGESLEKIEGLFDQVGEHGKKLGTTLMGVGAAGVGIGGILTAAAGPDQAAMQQLQAAVQAAGGSFDDYKDKIEKNVKSNESFGFTANQTYDAVRVLTQATGDTGKALGLMGVAADLAAAKHESLSAAATTLAKVQGGSTKVLKEFGIAAEKAGGNTKQYEAAQKAAAVADDAEAKAKQKLADVHALLAGKTKLTTSEQITLRNAEDAVKTATDNASAAHQKLAGMHETVVSSSQAAADNIGKLGAKLDGQASAAADTFTGRMRALKAEVEDGAAKLGQKYGPALTGVSAGISVLGGAFEGASAIMSKFKGAQEAATTATEGLTAAEDAETVTEGLALAPILLIVAAAAAVGVAIYELWTHWSTVWGDIKGVIEGVWNWIRNNWPLLLGILTGPIGLAVVEISRHWDDIVGFVEGIPGRIASAARGMWDGIKEAFRATINWIIDGWNDLHFHIPGFSVGPIKVGDFDLGMPRIPHLAAGGLVTSPTLALIGEAGPEAVVPLRSTDVGMGHTYNLTVNVYAPTGNADDIERTMRSALLQMKRRNVNLGMT